MRPKKRPAMPSRTNAKPRWETSVTSDSHRVVQFLSRKNLLKPNPNAEFFRWRIGGTSDYRSRCRTFFPNDVMTLLRQVCHHATAKHHHHHRKTQTTQQTYADPARNSADTRISLHPTHSVPTAHKHNLHLMNITSTSHFVPTAHRHRLTQIPPNPSPRIWEDFLSNPWIHHSSDEVNSLRFRICFCLISTEVLARLDEYKFERFVDAI